MSAAGDALGDAIKAAIDGVADKTNRTNLMRAMGNAIVDAVGVSLSKYAFIDLSADQTTNLTAGNHIEFDAIDDQTGGLVDVETGSGQADGIITLAEDHVYELAFVIHATTSGSTGFLRCKWRDDDTETDLDGLNGRTLPANESQDALTGTGTITVGQANAIFSTVGAGGTTSIKVEIKAESSISDFKAGSYAFIRVIK